MVGYLRQYPHSNYGPWNTFRSFLTFGILAGFLIASLAMRAHNSHHTNYAFVKDNTVKFEGQSYQITQCLWDVTPQGEYVGVRGQDGTRGGSISFYEPDKKLVTTCSVILLEH